jgi:hypothetical protein
MSERNPELGRKMNPAVWAGFASVMILGAACAAGGSGPSGDPNSAEPLGQQASSSSGSPGGSSGTSPCTTCGSSSDDSGEPTGTPPSGGSSSGTDPGGDDATPPAADDAGTGTGITLPPFSFPDASLGGSTPMSTGDGGANACSTKICIDPVFDCPLQGCFNGCTNFLCN